MMMEPVNCPNCIIDPLDLRGLTLIRVFSKKTGKIDLFGTYKGNDEGHLIVPPQSLLTTELVSEVHQALIILYPDSVWTLYPDKDSPDYQEVKNVFNQVGIVAKEEN